MTKVLYEKIGRRYVPWGDADYRADTMKVGEWRLTHCTANGRYYFRITPCDVEWQAAAFNAKERMAKAITEASRATPMTPKNKPYTAKQKKVLDECQKLMAAVGLLTPVWWEHKSAYEIAQAAIDVVRK